MIEYIVENIEKTTIDETVVIVGHKKEVLMDLLGDRVTLCHQEEQLGTGHAILSAASVLENKKGIHLSFLGICHSWNILSWIRF